MKDFFQKKIYFPILSYLKQGISPHKLALSMAFGFVIGTIPLFGITTLLCAIIAYIFRLNMGVIQIVNYAVYPLQFLFFIPFIKLGSYLFDAESFPFNIEQITALLKQDAIHLLMTLGHFNLIGLVAWIIIAPFIMAVIYFLSRWLFSRVPLSKS